MKTVSGLRKELEFDKGLLSLLEVLKTIAVAQFRSLEQRIKSYKKFSAAIEGFFEFMDVNSMDHLFLRPKTKRQLVVAITSDTGLLGALNIQVVAAALRELQVVPGRLVVVGERGKFYARETGMPFTAFGGITEQNRLSQALQLRDYIMNKLIEESIGYLKVVYPRPISFTVQRVETASFLPYVMAGQGAGKGYFSDTLMESSPADLLRYLVHLWIGHELYEIFGLSRLAEFAARFVHLEESSRKLKEMEAKLQQQYFRVRHEMVDRDMRELFSARFSYADKH